MKHITNMVRADGVLCFVSHASIEMMMMEFFFLQELFPLKNEKKNLHISNFGSNGS
jgi:hypothetical protein